MVKRTKLINGTKSGLVTAVDIGSTKIACFIVRSKAQSKLEVVGIGHQVSKGMKNGNIVDMLAVEESIRAAVESAEQMAGENVRFITVCFAGGKLDSKLISFDVSIAGHEIGDADPKKDLHVLPELPAIGCLLYTSPSPRDGLLSRMPSSA